VTIACACGKFIFFLHVHAGCSWKDRVHVGMTFLKVSAPPPPPKKKNTKMKDGNAREASVYLLGPNESSFRPLKLPESTILEKGCFLSLSQF
jgi:hypothetical protein